MPAVKALFLGEISPVYHLTPLLLPSVIYSLYPSVAFLSSGISKQGDWKRGRDSDQLNGPFNQVPMLSFWFSLGRQAALPLCLKRTYSLLPLFLFFFFCMEHLAWWRVLENLQTSMLFCDTLVSPNKRYCTTFISAPPLTISPDCFATHCSALLLYGSSPLLMAEKEACQEFHLKAFNFF